LVVNVQLDARGGSTRTFGADPPSMRGSPSPTSPGGADDEPAQALGEGGRLREARADLRGGDLGTAVGLASRVSLAEEAGPDEARSGESDDQRHWCDLPRPHASPAPVHV
jgi:hypothetical protein